MSRQSVGDALGYSRGLAAVRRLFRASEGALLVIAIMVGAAAGLLTLLIHRIARAMQSAFYGLEGDTLSAASHVSPWSLIALPIGGLLLGLVSRAVSRRWTTPVDVVEANALYGGVIPPRDSLIVCGQTLLSNGVGASVGLEAAYAQGGGGLASVVGQWLRLRRADMRILLGAGSGAAIGAAFGAPLTGAFYAFEIVIGAYTPAAIAPVAAACLSAVLTVRLFGFQAYLIALPGAKAITTEDYLVYAVLGIVCAVIGIGVMRAVTFIEETVRSSRLPDLFRPVVGGLLLIPLAMVTPQALSAGHGALHLDLGAEVALRFLCLVLVIKILASSVSIGFGFRGGLFFASLFIGSLVGQIFAGILARLHGAPLLDPTDAALIGMSAMAVSIVGGPMTMSLLVLETTHDFALTSVAVMASLTASTLVRETFGFSFSTWRMHTRGQTIRSARDIGWVRTLTVGKMMLRGIETAPANSSIAEFRRRFPLGSSANAVLVDETGRYFGVVDVARAYEATADPETIIGSIATIRGAALRPPQNVREAMTAFDESEADLLAVVDDDDRVIGALSEKYVRRRYADEIEKAQREMFGE